MRRKTRLFLSAFIAVSLAGLGALVYVHYRAKNTLSVLQVPPNVALKVERVRYSGVRGERLEWDISAISASRATDAAVTIFKQINVVFYAQDNTPYRLDADECRLDEPAKVMDIAGGVVMTSEADGYKARAEKLSYSLAKKTISSEGSVEVDYGSMKVSGKGLLVHVDSGTLVFSNGVTAILSGA